jgi:purine-nucleoside phosphorylase
MSDDGREAGARGTPHIEAGPGEIAGRVVMPGDPLRARELAERCLADVRLVTSTRNMLGYTGTCRGVPVSVLGSGMGGPSMGIYSYELFQVYGVERIVRAGTCGGLRPEVAPGDLVLALSASTDSNYAHQYGLPGTLSPCADFGLLEAAVAAARRIGARFHAGPVLSSDLFSRYAAFDPEARWRRWARMGCLASEMETHALYCNAAYFGRRALSVLGCAGSNVSGGAPARERALGQLFEVALAAACA